MVQLCLDVKEPVVHGPLALHPLISDTTPAPEYLCCPEAAAADALVVDEVEERASVAQLVVHNRAELPVLMLEGETILGAKQDRTLNVTVLCPPRVATTVPVSCVEQGRWGPPQIATRSPRHAPVSLRRVMTVGVLESCAFDTAARSDQEAVWDSVSRYSDRFHAASRTDALEDVYRKAAPDLDEIVQRLRPVASQVGVACAIGRRIACLDLFDKPTSLAAYWDALVAGYALDALGECEAATQVADVESFLAQVSEADVFTTGGIGMGINLNLSSERINGLGFEWTRSMVHLAAFAEPPTPSRRRPIRPTFGWR